MSKIILGLFVATALSLCVAVAEAVEPLTWRADNQGWEEEPAGITEARALTAAGDHEGARGALKMAQRAGASRQLVQLELAYVDLAAGESAAAREGFARSLTTRGPKVPEWTQLARLQLGLLDWGAVDADQEAALANLEAVANGGIPILAQRAQLALAFWVPDRSASLAHALSAAAGPDAVLRGEALRVVGTPGPDASIEACLEDLDAATKSGLSEAIEAVANLLPVCAKWTWRPPGEEPATALEKRLRTLADRHEGARLALIEILGVWVRGLGPADAPTAEGRVAGLGSAELDEAIAALYSQLAFDQMLAGDLKARDTADKVRDLDASSGAAWRPLSSDGPVDSIDPIVLEAFCLAVSDHDVMGAGWCLLGWRHAVTTGAVTPGDKRVRAILKATAEAADRDGKVLVQRQGLLLFVKRAPTLKQIRANEQDGDAELWMDLGQHLEAMEGRQEDAQAIFELVTRLQGAAAAGD